MCALDIILLVCFIPALISGISKGLVEQIVGLASLVLGAWLAFRFSARLSVWLAPYMNLEEKLLHVVSFAIILILTIVVLFLIGKLLTGLLKMADLGWINRAFGFIFAIFKTALLLGLLITVFEGLNDKWDFVKPEVLAESPVYIALKGFALKVFPYLKSLITNV